MWIHYFRQQRWQKTIDRSSRTFFVHEDMQSLPLGGDVRYHFMLIFTSQIILLSPKPSILPSFYSIFSIKQPMQGTFIIPYLKNWIFEFSVLKLKIYQKLQDLTKSHNCSKVRVLLGQLFEIKDMFHDPSCTRMDEYLLVLISECSRCLVNTGQTRPLQQKIPCFSIKLWTVLLILRGGWINIEYI